MFNPARWSWRALIVAGIVVYSVAAVFSEGYYHLDEHFQLLEFANYKLGGTPAADLPWEFPAQIRPTLQPLVAVGVMKALRAAGTSSPFTAALVLRLISGMLAIMAVACVSRRYGREFVMESSGKLLLVAAIALWFMPFLAVRFSSENWSATAFLFGVSLMPDSNAAAAGRLRRFAAMGLLLGLSFTFRFQMGFALVGMMAWLVVQRQLRWPDALALIGAGAAGILIGVAADAWFYGHLVFTPWRYFASNILQGKAAAFGTAPPWFYLPAFITTALPPISIALLLLAVLGIRSRPRQLFTWVLVAFVAGHVLVAHKELRFLFPMAVPFLWLVVAGWEAWRRHDSAGRLAAVTLRALIGINIIMLAWASTRPAQQFIPALRFVYDQSRDHHLALFAERRSPYAMDKLKPHFYDAPNVAVQVVPDFAALGDSEYAAPHVGDLLLQRRFTAPPARSGYRFERVFRTFPDWVLRFNVADWESRTEVWTIYRISATP